MTLTPTPQLLDETSRQQLAEKLRDPILCLAVDIVIRQYQPNGAALVKASPEQQVALVNQLAGMTSLLTGLQQLATPVTPTDILTPPEEWGYEPEQEQ